MDIKENFWNEFIEKILEWGPRLKDIRSNLELSFFQFLFCYNQGTDKEMKIEYLKYTP